jgi:hypothetical protein
MGTLMSSPEHFLTLIGAQWEAWFPDAEWDWRRHSTPCWVVGTLVLSGDDVVDPHDHSKLKASSQILLHAQSVPFLCSPSPLSHQPLHSIKRASESTSLHVGMVRVRGNQLRDSGTHRKLTGGTKGLHMGRGRPWQNPNFSAKVDRMASRSMGNWEHTSEHSRNLRQQILVWFVCKIWKRSTMCLFSTHFTSPGSPSGAWLLIGP